MTNFFTQLLATAGSLGLQITFKSKGDKITVGIFPTHSDKDINEKIKPISLTGTAEELDAEFFNHLIPPLSKINGVVSNIENIDADLKKLEEQKKGKTAGKKAEDAKPKKDDKKVSEKPNAEPKEEPKPAMPGISFDEDEEITNEEETN